MNNGLTDTTVYALVAKGAYLFAGTATGGIFRSSNNGTDWTAVNNGLGIYTQVMTFGLSGTNLFAGSYGGHVFLSTNDGATWTNVGTGLPAYLTTDALALSGPYLLAGVAGAGVWRRPLSEMITSVEHETSESPREFLLLQNYPNPFNPNTTIKYALPKASQVRLSVYDMLGRQVSVLVNEKRDPGVHEVKFDGSGLSSGVYLYRLRAGDFVQTRKLLLLK
jgi:hypothetical protein